MLELLHIFVSTLTRKNYGGHGPWPCALCSPTWCYYKKSSSVVQLTVQEVSRKIRICFCPVWCIKIQCLLFGMFIQDWIANYHMSLRFLKDLHGRRSKKAELQNEIRTCLNLFITKHLLCVKHSHVIFKGSPGSLVDTDRDREFPTRV